jgi:hypothetical protein
MESRFISHSDAFFRVPKWIAVNLYGELPGLPASMKEHEIPEAKLDWYHFFQSRELMERDLLDLDMPDNICPANRELAKSPHFRNKLEGIIQDMDEIIRDYYDPDAADEEEDCDDEDYDGDA